MAHDKRVEPQGAKELKAEQLNDYFQKRKPDCEVSHRGEVDLAWRFYFVKDDQNAYILDVNRDVLADWSTKQIIAILEKYKWEQVLEANLGKIPCFKNAGVELHQRPR